MGPRILRQRFTSLQDERIEELALLTQAGQHIDAQRSFPTKTSSASSRYALQYRAWERQPLFLDLLAAPPLTVRHRPQHSCHLAIVDNAGLMGKGERHAKAPHDTMRDFSYDR